MGSLVKRIFLAALVLAGQCALAAESQREPLVVFAAASLTDTLQQLGPQYTQSSGVPVKFSFAASSALAKQVESGAQADVFFSADQEWMNYLEQRGLIQSESRQDLLGNRLVLIAPQDSKATVKLATNAPLLAALGEKGRLATGDPDSVPAGRYAKSALTSLNLWNALEPRLARAENVRVALMYVARGEAPLGIVYATDAAVEPKVKVVDVFPESSHTPITYPVAALKGSSADAVSFIAFLRSEPAKAQFLKAGFSLAAAAPQDCTGFRFNLDEELKLFAGKSKRVAASTSTASATAIESGELYEVTLPGQASVKFAAEPGKATVADGSYAGILKINPKSATLRVTINEAAWIDVISGGSVLESTRHTGGENCKLLRKSVEFSVAPGKPLLIQISGSTSRNIRLGVTNP